jgi:hypothetical protein
MGYRLKLSLIITTQQPPPQAITHEFDVEAMINNDGMTAKG